MDYCLIFDSYSAPFYCMFNLDMGINVTRFAKTGHNSAFTEIHFIAPSRFGH